jgi:hypothetical protein
MSLRKFHNRTGEGLVDFEPCVVWGPEVEADPARWYQHVRVRGERLFEFGSPCGTCGVIFRKLRSVDEPLSDARAVELLGALERVPDDATLAKLARALARGTYFPLVTGPVPTGVQPGGPNDYFANEVVSTFTVDPGDSEEPAGPATPYWRLGPAVRFARNKWPSGPHTAMVTAIAMPMHDPDRLDRARIDEWKGKIRAGWTPTALAVSVLDVQAPGDGRVRAIMEHFLMTHCVLDGHHRIQAAAELGSPVRILSFWSQDASYVDPQDLPMVWEFLGVSPGR